MNAFLVKLCGVDDPAEIKLLPSFCQAEKQSALSANDEELMNLGSVLTD